MDPKLEAIISHLAKLKKAINEGEPKPEESYAIKLRGNIPRYVLGPLYSLQPPDEVVKIWAEQSDDPPPYTMDFDWKSTWESIRPFKGWPSGPSEVDHATEKKSKAKKSNPEVNIEPKRSWYDWYKALEPKLKTFWQAIGIYDVLALCATGSFPCDRSLIVAALCFWSTSTNCMRLRFGMMTPTLLDLAAIAGLRPHGIVYSAANLPEPVLTLDYSKSNKSFGTWVKTYFGYTGSSSGAPIGSTNGVSYTEHVAFLQIWLCKFLTCSKSSQITKEIQPLAEVLADGQVVALGPIFLAYLYRCLHQVVSKPMACTASGPIWLFQLWLQIYFPELGPANVTFRSDKLLGTSVASLPVPKHHVEDCFKFFYECSERSPDDLSMCLDHRYPSYLALDLANPPTLETKEERRELWANILISRELPYGLALAKTNHYPCGWEIYYPTAVARQLGFIQGIPPPMVDSRNHFSSWRVSIKEASEVNSVLDFDR